MKAVVLKPYEYADEKTQKKGNVPAHVVNYRRTNWGYVGRVEKITLVKSGRRVHFAEESDTDAMLVESANLALGIKTAAKAFQDALDGKTVALTKATSFGEGGATFALQRTGKRIAFVAPCGAKGYITVGEAEKIVAVLRSYDA